MRRAAPALYQDAIAWALGDAAEAGLASGRKRAPVQTGATRSALTLVIDDRPFPKFAAVRLGRVTRAGFPYPFALNSAQRRRYTYRTGRRRGRPTFLWFRGLGKAMKARYHRNLKRVAKLVQQQWAGR
jgi:hypothetical protein